MTETLWKLRHRAKKLELNIVYDKKNDGFILVDPFTNTVAAYPAVMTLEQVEAWLADLEVEAEEPF